MKKRYSFGLFLEAWVFLHWAWFKIQLASFQTIAENLGTAQFETPVNEIFTAYLISMKAALRRAGKYSLHKSNCYDQALAAMMLCRRRKIPATIYFGLSKSEEGLKAHAWLRCGTGIITGAAVKHKYTPVAWYGTTFNPSLKS